MSTSERGNCVLKETAQKWQRLADGDKTIFPNLKLTLVNLRTFCVDMV